LELRVPQDRQGRFSTELFERYQRSAKALVAALAEMYVQGVSTRKVKAITEELCGHSFSASAISAINLKLDEGLAEFARRRLDEACPYLIVDARYERVREAGVIRSQAVLRAIGIGWDGRRSILAVELANRESRSSWREFLLQLGEERFHSAGKEGTMPTWLVPTLKWGGRCEPVVSRIFCKLDHGGGGGPLWATRSVVHRASWLVQAAMRRASFLCSRRSSMFR
jgi:hypothetical protein